MRATWWVYTTGFISARARRRLSAVWTFPVQDDEFVGAGAHVDERQLPDEPLGVDGAVRHPGVVGVAHEVVHAINVELARDEPAVRSLPRRRARRSSGSRS